GPIGHGGPIVFPDAAEEAYRALAKIGKSACRPLINALKSPDPYTRAHAALALGEMHEKESTPTIVALLLESDTYVMLAALKALGLMHDRRAVESMLPLLKKEDPEIQCATAEALGAIGDERATLSVFDLLNDGVLAGCAVRALGGFRDNRAVDALIRVVRGQFDEKVQDSWSRKMIRFWATEGLAKAGARRSIQPITNLLASNDGDVRRSALRALGRMKATQALLAIRTRLYTSGETWEAAEAIGRISFSQGIALLQHHDPHVP